MIICLRPLITDTHNFSEMLVIILCPRLEDKGPVLGQTFMQESTDKLQTALLNLLSPCFAVNNNLVKAETETHKMCYLTCMYLNPHCKNVEILQANWKKRLNKFFILSFIYTVQSSQNTSMQNTVTLSQYYNYCTQSSCSVHHHK